MFNSLKTFFLGGSIRDELRATIREDGAASLAEIFRYGPIQLPQFCSQIGGLLEKPPAESELEEIFAAAAGPDATIVGYAQLVHELGLADDPTVGPDNPVDISRLMELFKRKPHGAQSPRSRRPSEAINVTGERITKDEFRSALQRLGVHASVADLDALFDAMDTDGSGSLDQAALRAQLTAGAAGLLAGTPSKREQRPPISPWTAGAGDETRGSGRRPPPPRPPSIPGSHRLSSSAWPESSCGSIRQWAGSNPSVPASPRGATAKAAARPASPRAATPRAATPRAASPRAASPRGVTGRGGAQPPQSARREATAPARNLRAASPRGAPRPSATPRSTATPRSVAPRAASAPRSSQPLRATHHVPPPQPPDTAQPDTAPSDATQAPTPATERRGLFAWGGLFGQRDSPAPPPPTQPTQPTQPAADAGTGPPPAASPPRFTAPVPVPGASAAPRADEGAPRRTPHGQRPPASATHEEWESRCFEKKGRGATPEEAAAAAAARVAEYGASFSEGDCWSSSRALRSKSTPASRKAYAERLDVFARQLIEATPGPGAYPVSAGFGAPEQNASPSMQSFGSIGKSSTSWWAKSSVARLEEPAALRSSGDPGLYDPVDATKRTVAQEGWEKGSPSTRSQRGNATFSSHSARELELTRVVSDTPGPGYYSAGKQQAPTNLSSSAFRSSTSQREPQAAPRAPPPGAYEVDAHGPLGSRSGFLSSTGFHSHSDRFEEPRRGTSVRVGPGHYDPAGGQRLGQQSAPSADFVRRRGRESRMDADDSAAPLTEDVTPGPGSYGLFDKTFAPASEGRASSSAWAKSSVARLEEPAALRSSGDPGLYDPVDATKRTVAQEGWEKGSPSTRSQRGNATFSSHSARELELTRVVSDTPGPGYYSAGKQQAPTNLSSSAFRSSTSQREPQAAPRAPPPGAYEVDAQGRTSTQGGDVAGLPFRSSVDRFAEPTRCTSTTVGPGAYMPEEGEAAAALRQATGGSHGAECFPFNSTSARHVGMLGPG